MKADAEIFRGEKKPVVLMAGKRPPPYFGQNIMTELHWDWLQSQEEMDTRFIELGFTRDAMEVRRASLHKLSELLRIKRRLAIYRGNEADLLLFSTGGPHLVPILRDIMLIPMLRQATGKLVVQFHAAGIADKLPALPSLLRKMLLRAYRRVDAAIVLTEYGRRDAEALGIRDIHVLPNAVPDKESRITHPSDVRSELRFFNVGQQCGDKGTRHLLEGFSSYKEQGGTGRLVLAGDTVLDFDGEGLEALIAELGLRDSVEWKGLLRGEVLDQVFAEGDVFVFPTTAPQEACPLVLLEALQAGKPIIATDWHANRELLPEGNWLLEVGSGLASGLAKAMLEVERERASYRDQAVVNRRFYEDHYSEVAGRERFIRLVKGLL